MDSEKEKWGMALEEDPIIDEEEEALKKLEMNFKDLNLDDLVERQQYQGERQKEGEYGNIVI